MADFREKYANIEKLVKYWESSTPVVITPINDQAEVSQFFLLIFQSSIYHLEYYRGYMYSISNTHR